MEKLQVELGSVVSGLNVSLELPTIIQTSGLPQDDALAFVKDCADGKRKIAKAVRNKYEGTSGTASEITEYSTFEELSNKISQIPIEVPMGSAMEQNGGVLPFYDVYNETLKAMASVGTEYKGVCAFELDKWSYDDDHKVTLSGADAYYTSDGTFIKDNIIYKNGSQIGELDNSLYQFQDQDAENSNRFVVYFFTNERYQVPKTLHTTSCLNLWCVKGTPLMNFNSDFFGMNSVNVYGGDLDVKETDDFRFSSISLNQKLRLPHIKSISGGTYIIENNANLRELSLPNLTTIMGGTYIFSNNSSVRSLSLPNLTTIMGGSAIFFSNTNLREIILPNLTTISSNDNIFASNTNLKVVSMPKVAKISYFLFLNAVNLTEFDIRGLQEYTSTNASLLAYVTLNELNLPNIYKCLPIYSSSTTFIKIIHLGNGMRDGVVGDIKILFSGTNTYLTNLTVAKGFKAKLDLTGCNGLSREVLVDIINNLADLTGETSLNLIMGATLLAKLTDADKAIATQKNWTLS